MSTDYRSLTPIRFDELFTGALDAYGVYEFINPEDTSPTSRCLTDGKSNFLWVYANDDGTVSSLKRYYPNESPVGILHAIEEAFSVEIFCEHEPQYWGFDTEEEWDAWQEKLPQQFKDQFYADLMEYLQGKPNGIQLGTTEEEKAKLGKKLVQDGPTLLLPENKDTLLERIDMDYLSQRAEFDRELDVPF